MHISRRAVLGGIGQSATLGALASALPLQVHAAAPAAAPAAATPAAAPETYCLATVYGAKGASFNADLFRDTHLPLLQRIYGKSASRIELRMPEKGKEGADAQSIIATVNIWIADVLDFSKRNKDATKDIAASLALISKGPVSAQVDKVLAEKGDDRLTVPAGTLCLSTYFPTREGATIDATYFAEVFYPKLAELYGTAVVRRVEVTGGAAKQPALLNSAHVYVRDEVAFFDGTSEAVKAAMELTAEATDHTNIKPMQALTRLHAVG